ncbi:MAG: alcohol dehydrogenase catalytic domain-containing protein [bacterium]|nr:alcohol dehydrogenase catalytic domain-containing protein [bacterium]
MRALFFDGEHAELVDHPEPDAAEGAIVAVELAGVCATDLEITRGYMNYRGVLGHEFVGRVEAGPDSWIGRRVVGEINIACGSCPTCAEGLGRHCPTRSVVGILDHDGAFAQRIALPVENLHRVPDAVPDEAAVFTEPLAAAFEILEQVEVTSQQDCLVFGDGRLGQLIGQVLHSTGASVTSVGKHTQKLALLEARGIATRELADWEASPDQADIVVEASGSANSFARAVGATRPRGTLVLKTTAADHPPLDLAPLVIHEINVVGSRCGPFEPALEALANGTVDVQPLIAARFPLEQASQALDHAGRSGVLKVLIDCAGT